MHCGALGSISRFFDYICALWNYISGVLNKLSICGVIFKNEKVFNWLHHLGTHLAKCDSDHPLVYFLVKDIWHKGSLVSTFLEEGEAGLEVPNH